MSFVFYLQSILVIVCYLIKSTPFSIYPNKVILTNYRAQRRTAIKIETVLKFLQFVAVFSPDLVPLTVPPAPGLFLIL